MEQRFLGEILHRRAGIPLDRLEAMYAIQREKGIDLTDLLVNGNVLDDASIAQALAAGSAVARNEIARGRIIAAVLSLQGRFTVVEGAGEGARRQLRSPSSATFHRSLVPC